MKDTTGLNPQSQIDLLAGQEDQVLTNHTDKDRKDRL